jgi:HD-like signal output (HDOD) protein
MRARPGNSALLDYAYRESKGRRVDVDSNPARTQDAAAAMAVLSAQIAAETLELPLLPGVAAEVLASSVDERADAARLAGLIQQDQSLVGHVLRVVNSPAFRGAVEIVALQQAIARLGMGRIREIALSASLKGTLLRDGAYTRHAEACWRTSLAAGLWAKEVARTVRRNVEVAYLCGLLHDIGTPVVLQRLSEVAPELADEDALGICRELAAMTGTRLAGAWSLPEAVTATIAHGGTCGATGPHADAVTVAACAILLARGQCAGALHLDALVDAAPVAHLNLYPEDLEGLLAAEDRIRAATDSMVT